MIRLMLHGEFLETQRLLFPVNLVLIHAQISCSKKFPQTPVSERILLTHKDIHGLGTRNMKTLPANRTTLILSALPPPDPGLVLFFDGLLCLSFAELFAAKPLRVRGYLEPLTTARREVPKGARFLASHERKALLTGADA